MRFTKSLSLSRLPGVSTLALMAVLLPAQAQATDVTITNDRTSSTTTTTELGAGAGTLTIDSGGSITVSSGTALTVNGPHNLVQTGTIESTDLAAGRGLFLDATTAQLLSNISIDGALTVAAPDDDFDETVATLNRGLELGGSFGLVGDITITDSGNVDVSGGDSRGLLLGSNMTGTLTNEGTITVTGSRSVAVDLQGNLTGDFLNTGTIDARNPDSTAVNISGALDGAFIHRGSILAGRSTVSTTVDGVTTTTDAIPGKAAIFIENNVTGGLLFDGIGDGNELDLDGDDTNDITKDSSITTNGGTPALHLSGGLTIGTVTDINGASGYGILHRGSMQVNGTSFGLSSKGFIIEGADANNRAVVEGGILFDTGTLGVVAGDADSTGITIGDYATVSRFTNNGTLDVDTTVSSTTTDGVTTTGPGGEAIGILVEENGIFNELTNEGNMLVAARGAGKSAVVVKDLSGTLASITNSGVILAQSADTEAGSVVAVDVSARTGAFSLTNTGDIQGDLWLSGGNDTVSIDGGTLDGDIFFSTGNDRLTLANDAEFYGSLAFDGTLDLFVNGADLTLSETDILHVTNASFSGATDIIFTVDPQKQLAASIQVDNVLSASSSVNIKPVLENFAVGQQTFDLITAGSINFADADATLALVDTPYLFDLALDQINGVDNSTVTLTVRPKTAAELDVSPALTTLYDNIISTGVDLDTDLERDLAGLTTKDSVSDALSALLPDITNASFNVALASKRQFANHLANRLTDYMVDENFEGGGWAREVTSFGDMTASQSQLSGNLLSVGLTFGLDMPVSKNFAVGLSSGFTLNGVDGRNPVEAQFSSFAPFLSLYGMGRMGNLYFGAQVVGQYTDIQRERTLDFGTLDRIIDSTTSGWNLTAMAETGYEIHFGNLYLKPFGRISAQSYSESGYIEAGGDSANLEVGDRSFSRVEGTFGASLGYDFTWQRSRYDTSIIRPELFYSYSKALSGSDPEALEAIFVGGDTKFAIEIDQMARSVEQFGGAFNIFGDGAKARIHYAREKLDDLEANAISFNFALTF